MNAEFGFTLDAAAAAENAKCARYHPVRHRSTVPIGTVSGCG